MTKRFAFMLVLFAVICGNAFGDGTPADGDKTLTVRTFQFKHKDADKATAVVKALMSAEGSISIQPSSNSMVITDRPENLKKIAAALTNFDAPPMAIKLSVRLITASRVDGAGHTPDELKDVAPKLAMLRYNVLENIGSANVEGREGGPGLVDLLDNGYRAEFTFGDYDPSTDSVKISDFKVARLQGDQLTQVLKTTLNLKLGQTVILGATKSQGGRALMIIVTAKK